MQIAAGFVHFGAGNPSLTKTCATVLSHRAPTKMHNLRTSLPKDALINPRASASRTPLLLRFVSSRSVRDPTEHRELPPLYESSGVVGFQSSVIHALSAPPGLPKSAVRSPHLARQQQLKAYKLRLRLPSPGLRCRNTEIYWPLPITWWSCTSFQSLWLIF